MPSITKGVVDKNEDFAVRHIRFYVYVNLLAFRPCVFCFLRSVMKYVVRKGVLKEVTVRCDAI
jgi:hypothetical protein